MMAEGSPQLRALRTALLDPISEARAILHRLQTNEMFQNYLRERSLVLLPLAAGAVMATLVLAGGAMVFTLHAGTLLALVATIVFTPMVLVGSLFVQAYVLLSWLEGRSLAKLQEQRRARERGPAARWIARRLRLDLGPAPRVPWVPAGVLVVLPALMLASVAPAVAAGLVVFQAVAAIVYARRDPVSASVSDRSGPRRAMEPPRTFAPPPLPKIQAPTAADALDLDFASPGARSGGESLFRRMRSAAESASRAVLSARQSGQRAARSAGRSGQRGVRFLVQLVLLNVLPFVEYCALISGAFVIWTGRQSASERDVALGLALVGAALVVGGLAAIVTKRMSFRFHVNPNAGYAGAAAVIAGLAQLIAGGLAGAAAHALATGIRQARLDAVLANPWLLLIPLALLLICVGLLLLRRSGDRVGALGVILILVPKTLIALAALCAGVAILGGWGWKTYDAQAFRTFLDLVPPEAMALLTKAWNAAIALAR